MSQGWTKIKNKYTGQVQEMPPATAASLVEGGVWEYVKPAAEVIVAPQAGSLEAAAQVPFSEMAARIFRPIFSRGPSTGR